MINLIYIFILHLKTCYKLRSWPNNFFLIYGNVRIIYVYMTIYTSIPYNIYVWYIFIYYIWKIIYRGFYTQRYAHPTSTPIQVIFKILRCLCLQISRIGIPSIWLLLLSHENIKWKLKFFFNPCVQKTLIFFKFYY